VVVLLYRWLDIYGEVFEAMSLSRRQGKLELPRIISKTVRHMYGGHDQGDTNSSIGSPHRGFFFFFGILKRNSYIES
jgi:hypothetical protein